MEEKPGKHGNFLSLEIVWKDELILEVEVRVSNFGYCGSARGYETSEGLETLARQLDGFPKGEQAINYKIENSLSAGDLLINFRPTAPTGLIAVEVHLEADGALNHQDSKLSVELVVEPNAIDVFQKSLTGLAAKQEGIAKLPGR